MAVDPKTIPNGNATDAVPDVVEQEKQQNGVSETSASDEKELNSNVEAGLDPSDRRNIVESKKTEEAEAKPKSKPVVRYDE